MFPHRAFSRLAKATLTLLAFMLLIGLFSIIVFWGPDGKDFVLGNLVYVLGTVFIAVTALATCLHSCGWDAWDFALGILPVQALALFLITAFSGLPPYDFFVLRQLFQLNLFVVLPWAVGFTLMALWSQKKRPQVREPPARH
jgi:hypothetical protein